MRTVVVYPGRFQPMLAHHKEVYERLKSEFQTSDVYIATSNKVKPPESPFTFEEKQEIARVMHNIPDDKFLYVKNPYNDKSYGFNAPDVRLIFAVGAKDSSRFPFTITTDGYAAGKNGQRQYIQPIEKFYDDPETMDRHAYIYFVDTVTDGKLAMNASDFRNAMHNAPNITAAKKFFTKVFGKYDDKIFKILWNKR